MEMEMKNKISVLNDKLKQSISTKRLGLNFQTSSSNYFYDSGTGKVFKCKELEYKLLNMILDDQINEIYEMNIDKQELLDGIDTILALIEKENILSMPNYDKFSWNLEDISDDKLDKIILELTENCNLRCKYCIYQENYPSFRTYETKKMSWITAKKALDYANSHSRDKLKISFYGGEPLLEYELMKKCINYCEENFSEKEIYYSFTTNLIPLTNEMTEFFSKLKHINILCSVDGPKEFHDNFRVDLNGNGSFEKVITNLELLSKTLGKKANESLSINTVLTPPFNKDRFNSIKIFFNSLEWLPKDCRKYCAYVNTGTVIKHDYADTDDLITYDNLMAWCLENICKNESDITFEKELEKPALASIYMRTKSIKPKQKLQRNGCCIPGYKRIYITSAGDFKICEKMGDSPVFGNVDSGIDKEKLSKYYIDEYDSSILNECKNCWACHMCFSCYSSCYETEGINIEQKKNMCASIRNTIKNRLVEFYEIAEKNPKIIEEVINLLNSAKK